MGECQKASEVRRNRAFQAGLFYWSIDCGTRSGIQISSARRMAFRRREENGKVDFIPIFAPCIIICIIF